MKISCWLIVWCALTTVGTDGQVAVASAVAVDQLTTATAQAPFYFVSERGPHHRVWQKVVSATNGLGQVNVTTNQAYIEYVTGMHYLQNGSWIESKEEIDIQPQGGAAALQGQHQAYFPAEIYSGAIQLVTPDGKDLQFRPLGLSYFDGTNSVLIAELTNSVGQILPSGNVVVYPSAFTDFAADLRYTYTRAGFEQDVILRERPPAPEQYGLNPATTRLQVLTEFFNPPQPNVTVMSLPAQGGVPLLDDGLDFGTMKIGLGRAFLMGTNAQTGGALVGKEWVQLSGRQFLIEEVPMAALALEVQALPQPNVTARLERTSHLVSRLLDLPAPRLVRNVERQKMQIAQANSVGPGLVLDFQTLSGTTNGYTFQGDTTYYISGPLTLLGGTNTLEGGTVLKFNNNAVLTLMYGSGTPKLITKSTDYRPVVFTAKDDDSVGVVLPVSSHNPAGSYYGNPALSLAGVGAQALTNCRIAYARQAIYFPGNSITLYDCQIVNCQNGLTCPGGGSTKLRNVLFANVLTNFNNLLNCSVDAQNTTFSSSLYLSTIQDTPYQSDSIILTNCLLVNVNYLTNTPVSTPLAYQLSGSYNGFYNCPSFGNPSVTNTFYPFQAAGAGYCYLTNSTAFTNAGSASIDNTLLGRLSRKTVSAPLVYTNLTINVTTNWSPRVQRDTNTPPALGYHYDPLDYLCSGVSLNGGSLVLTNGVAVGFFGSLGVITSPAGYAHPFNSQGKPDALNHLVWYPSVQEQPICINGVSTAGSAIFGAGSAGPPPKIITLRFTDMPMQGLRQAFFDLCYPYNWPVVTLKDCQLRGVNLSIGGGLSDSLPQSALVLQNSLLERTTVSLFNGSIAYNNGPGTTTAYYQNPLAVTLRNNLFWSGLLNLENHDAQATYHIGWTIKDNLFDTNAVTFSGDSANIAIANNGYHNTASPLEPNPYIVDDLSYAPGPFGPWYIGSSSPTLIDQGSRPAAAAGLFQYTIQANQMKEGLTLVDIGFHYVAADGNDKPLATFGDGIPDYIEDANGNGLPDSWELAYFGNLNQAPTGDYDSDGTNNISEYQNGTDPNKISFSCSVLNQYVNSGMAWVGLNVTSGVPSSVAILVNDTNLDDAVWNPFSSSNVLVSLGSTEGDYNVFVGLRGRLETSQQTWHGTTFTVDTTPPAILITNPAARTVSKTVIQLQGCVSEPLSSLNYDLSNSSGQVTNQEAFVTGAHADTNLWKFTTHYFQAYDLVLANGANAITLRATDLAGNTSVTNLILTLDTSTGTNPPTITITWPQDNSVVAGTNFTLQGLLDDDTASVAVSSSGSNVLLGTVERGGRFRVDNVPLAGLTNVFTIAATNANGYSSSRQLTVGKSTATVTVSPLTADQLSQPFVMVSGFITGTGQDLWINGVLASVSQDGSWQANNVPIHSDAGSGQFNINLYPTGSDTNNTSPSATLSTVTEMPPVVRASSYLQRYSDWYSTTCYTLCTTLRTVNVNWELGVGGTDVNDQFVCFPDGSYTTNESTLPAESLPATWAWEWASVQSGSTWRTFSPGGDCPYGFLPGHDVNINIIRTRIEVVAGGPAQQADPQLIRLTASFISHGQPLSPSLVQSFGRTWSSTATNAGVGELYVSAPAGGTQEIPISAPGIDDVAMLNAYAEAAPLRIFQDNTTEITGQTNNVVVGQSINLVCRPYDTNATLSNFQWKIPGFAISNYIATLNAATVYSNYPTINSNVAFYWVDGANNRQIECSATIGGQKGMGKAIFNVLRPVASLIAVTTTNQPAVDVVPSNFVEADPSTYSLTFGTTVDANGNPLPISYGIRFYGQVTTPANGAGTIALVQVVTNTLRTYTASGGTRWKYSSHGLNYVDTFLDVFMFDTKAINASQTQTNADADTPNQGLNCSNITYTVNDQFKTYLIYQPTNGIWVTLQSVCWNWSGSTTNDNSEQCTWTRISGSASQNPSAQDDTELPTWIDSIRHLVDGPPEPDP